MTGKKTRTIKKLTATNAGLEKDLSDARSQLTKINTKLIKSDEKAQRFKTEAAEHRAAAARSEARLQKLQKKLDRAMNADKPAPAAEATEAAPKPKSKPESKPTSTSPDASWTVVQLRAEARARGLTGLSNKPKADLLAALS